MSDYEAGTISTLPRIGSIRTTAIVTNLVRPTALEQDVGTIFFAEHGTVDGHDGTIKRVDKRGGTPTTLASGLDKPDRLVRAGDRLYFTTSRGDIQSIGVDGSSSRTLVKRNALLSPLAVDTTYLYFGDSPISVDNALLARIPLAGGAPEWLWHTNGLLGIAADSTRIFWVSGDEIFTKKKR